MDVESDAVQLRTTLRPGDIGRIIALHGELYAAETGWDWTFEAYAGKTFSDWAQRFDAANDRVWIAERAGELVGSIGIVRADDGIAQLRWFLLHPSQRGRGLGRRLMEAALTFCRERGYTRVFLWTAATQLAAIHLYRSYGFELTHQETVEQWGAVVTEERYDLALDE